MSTTFEWPRPAAIIRELQPYWKQHTKYSKKKNDTKRHNTNTVFLIEISSRIEQQLSHFRMTLARSPQQRGESILRISKWSPWKYLKFNWFKTSSSASTLAPKDRRNSTTPTLFAFAADISKEYFQDHHRTLVSTLPISKDAALILLELSPEQHIPREY